MILTSLADFQHYTHAHSRFQDVAAFLARPDLAALAEGRHDLDGDRCFVLVSRQAATRPIEAAKLEAHRAYVDVQVVLDGLDTMGWAPLDCCTREVAAFDATRDIGFFEEGPVSLVPVPPGSVAVFFPEDAHAPLIGDGHTVHKLVVKVSVDKG